MTGDLRATPRVVFLPGVSGAAAFWSRVAGRLPDAWETRLLSWPGAGDQPHDPRAGSFEDLVSLVGGQLEEGTDLVAQSMGGAVAIAAALRFPRSVRRLVLVATSGGLDVAGLGGADWREAYRQQYPNAASWIGQERIDLSDAISQIRAPTLLLWGDADPISPVGVGERLLELLPDSALWILPGGTHSMTLDQPDALARSIVEHLA